MENILSQIVLGQKETTKALNMQTKMLGQMLKLEDDRADLERKRFNAEKRNARRQKKQASDMNPLQAILGDKKDAKKRSKSFFEQIGDMIGGLFGGLGALGILKALGLTAIGGTIAAYFASPEFRKFVNGLVGEMFKAIMGLLDKGIGAIGNAATGGDNTKIQGGRDGATAIQTGIGDALRGRNRRKAARELTTISRGLKEDAGYTYTREDGSELKGGLGWSQNYKGAEQAQEAVNILDPAIKNLVEYGEMDDKLKFLEERINRPEDRTRWSAATESEEQWKDRLQGEIDTLKLNLAAKENLLKKQQKEIQEQFGVDIMGDVQKKQKGGHINVPGSGSGDKVPFMLPGGSFVMNRNAAAMLQAGGMVPTLLEPGEKVFGPGSWGPMEMMMNNTFGRFQNGGEIPTTEASAAMKGTGVAKVTSSDEEKLAQSSSESAGKVGAAAIISAAEAASGLMAGTSNACADTTREVLKRAGHPQAGETTKTGDLDVPKGYGIGNGRLAGSFAGSDMGTVYQSGQKAPPGSVIMWRGTTQVDKYGPDAVTHVGLKGNGDDIYHHGTSPGWRKDSNSRKPFDLAVDLNGKASGGGAMGYLGGLFGAVGGLGAELIDTFLTVFGLGDIKEMMGMNAPQQLQTGSDTGSGASSGSGDQTSAGVGDPTMKSLLNAIAKAEGTTKSYGTMFGGAVNQDLANGNLTVKEAMALSYANPGSSATGRYQFMHQTIKDLVNWGVWKEDEKLTNDLQDIGAAYLIEKKRKVNVKDGLSKSEVQDLSWEWASIKGNNYTYGGKAQGYVGQDKFLKWVEDGGGKIQGMQTGGIANVGGTGSTPTSNMLSKSQQQFAEKIAEATTPIVVPMGGGGGGGMNIVEGSTGNDVTIPSLPSNDSSVVAMEYKYRITMGASV